MLELRHSEAEVRIGAPWQRADELTGLRNRQKEIEDQLAATAEPVPDQHSTDLVSESMLDSSTPVEPQRAAPAAGSSTADAAAAAGITARLDALQNRSRAESPGVEM
ncbi:MAG: hypothetical protein M5T61_20785 [Acidimicrobiia bacterium]|nr:hypothetical protein [Acidimicrobiia bacterium]